MATRHTAYDRLSDYAPAVVRESGIFRQCTEALICLALAVILFRSFVAEGYLISTGSMAPCLLGYHRQVVCPSCTFAFSRGTHYEDEQSILAVGRWPTTQVDVGRPLASSATVCPNCGLSKLDVRAVPRNEGDQLLVQKHLYQLRSPRRWEVVVFRHPQDPDQAYVKRVVGLPGESIELIDGDVYADGQLQRKPLPIQQGMRISVYSHDHVPTDADWRPRWRIDPVKKCWQPTATGFGHTSDGGDELSWLTYHHWIRAGGEHKTSVPLSSWPQNVADPEQLDRRLSFAADRNVIEYSGVLPPRTAERLRTASQDRQWTEAITELETKSHECPILDLYGYNHPESGHPPSPVHDLMLEAGLALSGTRGELRMRMTDGWHWFETVFDVTHREVRLNVDDNPHPIRSAPIPEEVLVDEATVTVSLFDRQVLVCLNGEPCLQPLLYTAEDYPRRMTNSPVQLGAAGLDLKVSHLCLYRDVHYTSKYSPERSGPARLGAEEFFVLGDNSPVSVDSRLWDTPAIPRALLVGKPFLVHLPSRQGRLDVAGDIHHIRIPDFSRIRYIH